MSRTVKKQRKDLEHIEADIYYCSKTDKFLKYNPDNDLYQWYQYPYSKAKPLCGVYYLYDKLYKKYYIGSSVDIVGRVLAHKSKFNKNPLDKWFDSVMYKASMCHGDKFIEYGLLELCSKEDLAELERYYIRLADSVNNGWNGTYNTNRNKYNQ